MLKMKYLFSSSTFMPHFPLFKPNQTNEWPRAEICIFLKLPRRRRILVLPHMQRCIDVMASITQYLMPFYAEFPSLKLHETHRAAQGK